MNHEKVFINPFGKSSDQGARMNFKMQGLSQWLHFYTLAMKPDGITLRVYGVLVDPVKGILISDEREHGKMFSKFPGGGLEPGEGLRDCLIREWKEELNQLIEVGEHLYTTDFFQRSAFHPNHQVISVYYWVKALGNSGKAISEKAYDFGEKTETAQSFRWIEWKNFSEKLFAFPIDQRVARLLLDQKNKEKNAAQ
jgi:ADP-ribose pyrophosphatase YjhB (NUDIX family)